MSDGGSRVVAALDAGVGDAIGRARGVLDTAVALGRLIHAAPSVLLLDGSARSELRSLADDRGIEVESADGDPIDALVGALRNSSVVAGVVAAGFGSDSDSGGGGDAASGHTVSDIVDRADRPVAVVPLGARVTALRRLVVALDGSEQTQDAVARFAALLQPATPEVVVVHIFDDRTTPAFLDRPERDLAVWQREFLERRSPWPGARLRWASGQAGAAIAEAAAAEEADGIVAGWWQDRQPAWATATTELLARATVPVILLPVVLNLNDHQRQGRLV